MQDLESIWNDTVNHPEDYLDWMKDMVTEAVKTTVITYASLAVFIGIIKLFLG